VVLKRTEKFEFKVDLELDHSVLPLYRACFRVAPMFDEVPQLLALFVVHIWSKELEARKCVVLLHSYLPPS